MKKLFPILFLTVIAGFLSGSEVKIDLKNAAISAPKKYAALAKDLKFHLDKISGGKIAIYRDAARAPKGKYIFHLGKAPRKRSYKKEEGVYTVTPKAAYFHGEGVSHAVYLFLEEAAGVRWPSRRIAICPRTPLLTVKDPEKSFAPQLNLRGIRGLGLWGKRMRFGGHDQPHYGHAFTKWWYKYGKTHPEYFAMNYGKRQPCGTVKKDDLAQVFSPSEIEKIALCVSSHAVVDQIIANWDKKSLYINICENDAPGILSCHCKDCMSLDVLTPAQKKDWSYALADRYIVFANRVLAKARKYRKDVKVAMYAYNATQDAPRKVKPDPAVVIGIVPTVFSKAAIQKYVGSWKAMGMNTFFYRPNRHFYYSHTFPCGYEKHFYEIMQYLIKQNAIGFDYDAPGYGTRTAKNYKGNPHTDFSDYVLCKTMQDPSKPFSYWEDHYLSSYGKAASDMKKYFHFWRENVWEKRIEKDIEKLTIEGKYANFGRALYRFLGKYYKDSDFVTSKKFLDAAKKKALTADERALLNYMIEFHDHAHLTAKAVITKKDADALNLLLYRKKHNHPLMPWGEQYYGDVCGIKRVINLQEYTPPFRKLPLFWKFRIDPENVGLKEKWFLPAAARKWKEFMPVNNAWERPYSHYRFPSKALREKMKDYNGIGWYSTSFKVPADWKDRKIYLYFGAVDESAWVYCNGKEAGKHLFLKPDDWHTPFAIEITKQINWKKSMQDITVRVEDKTGAGGIWKEVFLVSKKKK